MLVAFRSQLSATEHGSGIKHSRRKAKTPRGGRVEWRVFYTHLCELRLNLGASCEYYRFLTLMSENIHNPSENRPTVKRLSGERFSSWSGVRIARVLQESLFERRTRASYASLICL